MARIDHIKEGNGKHCIKCCHILAEIAMRRAYPRFPALNYHLRIFARGKAGVLPIKPCEVCGNPKAERHHKDYARPLVVRYLCRKHHYALHIGAIELGEEYMAKTVKAGEQMQDLSQAAKDRYAAIGGIVADKKQQIEVQLKAIKALKAEIAQVRKESAPLLAYLKRAGLLAKAKRTKKEKTEEAPVEQKES